MPIAGDMKGGILTIINEFGSTAHIVDPDGSNGRDLQVVITSIGRDDGQLINAVGIEGRVMYLLPQTQLIKKFSRVTSLPNNRTYVVQDVHDILVDNAMIGHKVVLKS